MSADAGMSEAERSTYSAANTAALYTPVDPLVEGPASTSGPSSIRHIGGGRSAGSRALATTAAAVALVVAFVHFAGKYGRESPAEGPAAEESAFLQADEDVNAGSTNRMCVHLENIRLSDGGGSSRSAKTTTSDECIKLCSQRSSCMQAIYSAGNGGCYTFPTANPVLFTEGNGVTSGFVSALCDEAANVDSLYAARAQVFDALRLDGFRRVKERWAEAERNATEMLYKLSDEDKMSFVHGSSGGHGYAGFLKPSGIPWKVPPLRMQDGPQGFNPYQARLAGTATQFPALLAVAASFNPETARRYATAVAEEFVTKGANVLLGPDVEVTRAALSGRGFETISGEDPFLGSELVRPYVQAVQEKGIIATVKHWLDNNQEIYRQSMTALVGERAQHEIYMPVFKAAFEAGAGAVMCSYNKINGQHACENSHLLTKLLREDLGFKGYVVSDWGATHDAERSAEGGLDIEMPEGNHYGSLPTLIGKKQVEGWKLDHMVTHVLSAMYFAGHFEGRFPLDWSATLDTVPKNLAEHRAVALDVIADGAVLLKNKDATLPFDVSGKSIAMIGKYCDQVDDKSFAQGSVYSGGGSGYVITNAAISPHDGMKAHFAKDKSVKIWTGEDGSSAGGADIAVICAAGHAEEGWDRSNFTLPEAAELIQGARVSGGDSIKIVVIASAPGAITTEWMDGADAVLLLFEPGEQVGPAVPKMLTGEIVPAGRLPVSLPKVGENRFTKQQYPGVCENNSWCDKMKASFSESTLIGYRWNDAKEVPSAFPFGFGLAYTDFTFSEIKTSCGTGVASVSVKIANTGIRPGTAVPQLYVGFESLKPVLRQLRGFQKLNIPAGSDSSVVFVLREADWSYFDEAEDKWISALSKGEAIKVWVGSSSTDLPLHAVLPCSGETFGKDLMV